MPECGYCRDCKWWAEEDMIFGAWGHLCKQADSASGKPCTEDTLAYAKDFESYEASLLTSPDFGCVMWEAKDA